MQGPLKPMEYESESEEEEEEEEQVSKTAEQRCGKSVFFL